MSSRIPLSGRIAVGFVLGMGLGLALGPRIGPLGDVGKSIIGLVKILAGPFLFGTILKSVVETPLTRSDAKYLIGVTTLNATLAAAIGMGLSIALAPGHSVARLARNAADSSAAPWKPPDWSLEAWLRSLVPQGVFEPFTQNAVLSLAIAAVVLGLALRRTLADLPADDQRKTATWLFVGIDVFHRVFLRMLSWAVELVPVAVLAVVAKAVGEKGLDAFSGLWMYLAVGAAGLLIQMTVVYLSWVRWARIPLRTFGRVARKPLVYALGTNSSLATLPLTLDALRELKVSPRASTLGACIGTNLNNDGILLYEAMAVLFVAQAHGVDLDFSTRILVLGLCWLATVGIAGVPEAGFISLSIVLTQVGLPLELLPFLLSVDWILARLRSVTNVCSDLVTSIAIDRWMRRDDESSSSPPAPPAS